MIIAFSVHVALKKEKSGLAVREPKQQMLQKQRK